MTFWKTTGAILTALVLFVLLIAAVAVMAHDLGGVVLLVAPLAVVYWAWLVAIPWFQRRRSP